jgi:hypothetical protein
MLCNITARSYQDLAQTPSWRTVPCLLSVTAYEGVPKSFRTESVTTYALTTINTRCEATQRVMLAKPTRLTHKIVIQLHLMTESCTIFSSRSRRPVRKLLDIPSYVCLEPFSSISDLGMCNVLATGTHLPWFFIILKLR